MTYLFLWYIFWYTVHILWCCTFFCVVSILTVGQGKDDEILEDVILNHTGFCKSLRPVNGYIYLGIYFAITAFAGTVAEVPGNAFLTQSFDFVVYLLLLLCGVALMHGFYIKEAKACGKDFEQNLHKSLIILLVTVIAMASQLVSISILTGTDSANQSSVVSWQTNAAIKVITVCILGPIVEETVYRGILFRLLRRDAWLFSHILVALFFGLEHCIFYVLCGDMSQLIMVVPYATLGFGLSVMYENTHNFYYPLIAHIFVNAVSFAFGIA